jgi:hypothetical protein
MAMIIHWWNTDKLVERLAEKRVSEHESVRYARIAAVQYTLATYLATWFGGYQSWLLIYEFVIVTAIALVGVNECFKANGGLYGIDFLKRMAVISVPVGIKVMLGSIILGQFTNFVFPYFVTAESFKNPSYVYQLFSFTFTAAFMAVFYWRLTTHFSRLSAHITRNQTV